MTYFFKALTTTACLTALLICGCDGNDHPVGDTGAQNEDETADEPEDDTGEPGDDEAPSDVPSLFDCELAYSCDPLFLHIDLEPADAIDCVANLTALGSTGAFQREESIGGTDVYEDQREIVLLGDGTALVQRRFRACDACDEQSLPFEVFPTELCDVVIDAGAWDACEGTGACGELWSFQNCAPTEFIGCEQVDEILDVPDEEDCRLTGCGDDEVCVQPPEPCECNEDIGEVESVPVPATCQPDPAACADARDLGACLGEVYCDADALEPTYWPDDDILFCVDALDCFGRC